MTEIYTHLLSKMKLTPAHKHDIMKKRGLSEDAIIKGFQLKSGGSYLLEFEQELVNKFDASQLLASGVFVQSGKGISISPILLTDRVVIPYLDKKNNCYLLRPHKLGLKDIGIQIYQKKNVWGDRVILTEGEFKAMAGVQFSFSTIAIPGISSFSEAHFPVLTDFLNQNGIKHIYILFDNEIKDDPKYPNYKENPAKRHDTEFYAYYMAKRLSKEGFSARIALLPDSWRKDGKVDLDGALAQGKTLDHIGQLVKHAITHQEYLSEVPKEVKKVILRKDQQKRYKSKIRVEFNKYLAQRKYGQKEYEEYISNFIIKIIATHDTIEGMMREVVFVNEVGDHSAPVSIGPGDMAKNDAFKTFCYGKGNFIWRGRADDLMDIWEQEFIMDDGRKITESDHVGWNAAEKLWLFGNTAITYEGKELRPDLNHVFWLEKKGIKPIPLGLTTGRNVIQEGIPYLNLHTFDVGELHTRLGDSIGRYEANLALGWCVAVLFMEEAFREAGCFPFLFVTGMRGSGKSTVAEWLMQIFGTETGGKMASDTTTVAIQRYLSYNSSLPVYIDEYRNVKEVAYKNGVFRNAYNRQGAGKGVKANFGIREAKIRGTLLLAGEETPRDNALLTRCVVISILKKQRSSNHFNWFMRNRPKFSYVMYDILKRKPDLVKQYIKDFHAEKDYFVEQGADDRLATNRAIIAAGHHALFGTDFEFVKAMVTETLRTRANDESENVVNRFFNCLLDMQSSSAIDMEKYLKVEKDEICMNFNGLYTEYCKEHRRMFGTEPFKDTSIREYMREINGYVADTEDNRKRFKGGFRRRCLLFKYDNAPEQIRELVDSFPRDSEAVPRDSDYEKVSHA